LAKLLEEVEEFTQNG
jgi:hypothetical protein